MKTFIVKLWSAVFRGLRCVSLYQLLVFVFPRFREDHYFDIEPGSENANRIIANLRLGKISEDLTREFIEKKKNKIEPSALARISDNEWKICTEEIDYTAKIRQGKIEIYLPNWHFVEIWGISNLVLALLSVFLYSIISKANWLKKGLCIYAILRIFELFVYLINVSLFDWYRSKLEVRKYALRSYLRIIVLILQNYVEILLWYALIYRNLSGLFDYKHISPNSIVGSMYFSLVTMATLGYGDIIPMSGRAALVCFFQTAMGVLMALIIIARFIPLLPRPNTFEPLEKE